MSWPRRKLMKRSMFVLQRALSRPRKEYEDLGHVNDTFVISLDLKPGQFKRI
jgi:hypothetical protein